MSILIGLAALTVQAVATSPVRPEAAIEFASSGGIADWHERDETSLYLMDRPGRWYLATFEGRCWNLPLQNTLQFETDPTGRFDAFGAVITQHGRCQLKSLVRTERPLAKGLKGRSR